MNRNSKNVVRLTESKLRGMIKEAVKQVLDEVKIQNPETGEYEDVHGYYGQGGENRSNAAKDWYEMAKIRHLKSRKALEQGDLESGIKQYNKAQRNSQNASDYEPYLNKHLGRM